MLAVTVIAVGKLGENYLRDAMAEYQKRMRAYFRLEIIEIAETKLPRKPSKAETQAALEQEAEAILAKLPPRARILALCIEGTLLTSEELAAEITRADASAPRLAFIIGSSRGLSERVKQAAHTKLSLSRMTFPHQLTRVMLCEQLYRAGSINAGGKYHK